MKYFLDNGTVVAFDDDADPSLYEGLQEISEQEALEIANPTLPIAKQLRLAKDELRVLRLPMLAALNGIGWRADRAGNTVLGDEAVGCIQALLDITDDPVLNAATTIEAMRAAGVAAYRRAADAASAELRSAFKEITGGLIDERSRAVSRDHPKRGCGNAADSDRA